MENTAEHTQNHPHADAGPLKLDQRGEWSATNVSPVPQVPLVAYSPLRGAIGASLLTVAAAVILGLVPMSVVFSSLAGVLILTAWVTGAIAFASSLYAPRYEVAQAVAFHDQQRAAAPTRRAA
jgi:hypothetical protein